MLFLSKKSLFKSLKLLPINFDQPWWQLLTMQKELIALIIAISISTQIFWTLSPLFLAWVYTSGSALACGGLLVAWLLVDCLDVYAKQLDIALQVRCIDSIYQGAHHYLLTVDPRYHVHRSSGTILGKIDRGARGYEEILENAMHDFLRLIVALITMNITLYNYSKALAISISIVFIGMFFAGYHIAQYTTRKREQGFIKTDDAFRSAAVENMLQIHQIRASFASDYMSQKLTQKITDNMYVGIDLWFTYQLTKFALMVIYLSALFSVICVMAWQTAHGLISVASAVGLTVAYINSTKKIVDVMKPFRHFMRGWTSVHDLFEFIHTFGKETFPVLGNKDSTTIDQSTISILAAGISFDYDAAQLFNNHSFTITCPQTQTNKLYGIIGPSGSGKTTLLSILGGQLKPISGTVLINDIDIYTVPDSTRRQLIALQGQVSSAVRGNARYNLLFGLPADHGFDDTHLTNLLERVGLFSTLATHQGLETMLGEGGLSISGGQRQRLNFASLYLRAQHYKPLLILIDEPTSSLDELSEATITTMIEELAHTAVTLVIAHRLKTVEQATGIIDLSLLEQEKTITPYTRHTLLEKSEYYQRLTCGKVQLDSRQ